MRIIVVTHPNWIESSSMPRFTEAIRTGMEELGHEVTVISAPKYIQKLFQTKSKSLRKWFGYFDQFVLYPFSLNRIAKKAPPNTVFVVIDQALGILVPRIIKRPHAIHCHDFMALQSANGEFPQNPVGFTGKVYQKLIKRGFLQGNKFICVSEKTKSDLLELRPPPGASCEVVYNAVREQFQPMPSEASRQLLSDLLTEKEANGFLLHVGGNQWYKNRSGVIRLYNEWCKITERPIPLWMIGAPPTSELNILAKACPSGGEVRFLQGLTDEQVAAAYNRAQVFLFPSLAEGFGWPIAEALACGTPVLTTRKAPMTEVGGEAAFYLNLPEPSLLHGWAVESASQLQLVLDTPRHELEAAIAQGLSHVQRFNRELALANYERQYLDALASYQKLED